MSDLADLSIEELAETEITSVSKRKEKLSDAPAAVYVISREDIRRAGATSIPEILRLAPNLQVARVDASQYAISARGFNSTIANKLLVLIDGRTVYTPLFSGVFWDAQDTLLQDIERIEVISGPGATLWGANAVNGVINIITQPSSGTRGALLIGDVGDAERGVSIRYGGAWGAQASYRIYGKFFEWDHTSRADGSELRDDWHRGQVGFRTDWDGGRDSFTIQGDAYQGSRDQIPGDDTKISGANLLARWTRALRGEGNLQVQSYIDFTQRDIPGTFAEDLGIFDIEFQHFLRPVERHGITWGGGYRHADDSVNNSPVLAFLPDDRGLDWGNVFVQDEIEMSENRLRLTLGAKLEHNPFTDFEFLPSMRLAWKINAENLLWGSLSRALRSPSRLDTELFVPGQPPFLLAGGPDFRSEISQVFQLGYRTQPSSDSTLSVTFFQSQHDRLRALELSPAGLVLGNPVEGESTGVEAWGTYQVKGFWRMDAGFMYLDQDLRFKAGSAVPPGAAPEGNDPKYQWTIRSAFDLSASFELDLDLRGVGPLSNPAVPDYRELDLRLAWLPLDNLELSITGRNLLHHDHAEFGSPATRGEIERSVLFRLMWSL